MKPMFRTLGLKFEFGMYSVGLQAYCGFRVQGLGFEGPWGLDFAPKLGRTISYGRSCVSEPSFESALCECSL